MKRRRFLAAAGGLCLAPGFCLAQEWSPPPRFVRPDIATDEGGLWAMMDREEIRLRRSPFSIHDAALHDYVRDIICRLIGDHCADVRVYLVRNAFFNANMAPNGMMQVWSGLMLRMDNEAQLAAVLGHEIGHYLQRHSLDSLRDLKTRTAVMTVFAMFGPVGSLGALAIGTGAYSYSRDHEREADRIGLILMSRAGYDPGEAAKVWSNLLAEAKAGVGGDPSKKSVLFATHPAMDERRETLAKLAAALPAGGEVGRERWEEMTAPYRREWLNQEVKRGQFEESIVLLNRLILRSPAQADYLFCRGEVYRTRAQEKDLDAALADYQAAAALGNEPAETYKGMALIYRQRGQDAEARENFQRYLEKAPTASDAEMIKSYIGEVGA